jgi:hypothetical protein
MNTQTEPTFEEARNRAVMTSYLAISKIVKQLIAALPQDILRYIVELDSKAFPGISPKLHELVSPIFYLCLRESNGLLMIHFGCDMSEQFASSTNQFIRAVYKLTMAQYTEVDIEDCVQTDSIITDTSGLFDLLQWKHPSYPYKIIKYKSITGKRKILSVA